MSPATALVSCGPCEEGAADGLRCCLDGPGGAAAAADGWVAASGDVHCRVPEVIGSGKARGPTAV
jgi:hypothetical protein